MEKLGVEKEVMHHGLRSEEARLMQEIQSLLTAPHIKEAAVKKQQAEQRLMEVRAKITELDVMNTPSGEL